MGADTVYDDRPWNQPPPWAYSRPWDSNEERLTQQALNAALIPGAELAALVRPPLPIELFPPRYGYDRAAPGLLDVLAVSRELRSSDATSGGNGGYSGASRNSLGQI